MEPFGQSLRTTIYASTCTSAAAYAPGGPSLVVLFAYGGAQDGEAAGNVLGRGMEKLEQQR